MNPFTFLNDINYDKLDIMVDDTTERAYNSFVINRTLSYFPDTVALANVINQHHHLDKKLQYHFLINTVRKRKRFSKWEKPEMNSDVEVIKEYYGYSDEKARQALTLLTPDQLQQLKNKVNRGGRKQTG